MGFFKMRMKKKLGKFLSLNELIVVSSPLIYKQTIERLIRGKKGWLHKNYANAYTTQFPYRILCT